MSRRIASRAMGVIGHVAVCASFIGCGSSASVAAPPSSSHVTTAPSSSEWLAVDMTKRGYAIPVSWTSERLGASFALPQGSGRLPSPDGKLFLVTRDSGAAQQHLVVDRMGVVLRQLDDPAALYFWSSDGTGLCVVNHPHGEEGSPELGYVSLSGGAEAHLAKLPYDPQVSFYGPLACSPATDRIVIETAVLQDSMTTTSALLVYSAGGQEIAERRYNSEGAGISIRVSNDGRFAALNPHDPTRASVVHDLSTDAVVVTLPGRHIRAFDATDDYMVTVDAPPLMPNAEPRVTIDLRRRSGGIVWSAQGYYRGALTGLAQDQLVIGISAEAIPPSNGYSIVSVTTDGRSHTVFATGSFA